MSETKTRNGAKPGPWESWETRQIPDRSDPEGPIGSRSYAQSSDIHIKFREYSTIVVILIKYPTMLLGALYDIILVVTVRTDISPYKESSMYSTLAIATSTIDWAVTSEYLR